MVVEVNVIQASNESTESNVYCDHVAVVTSNKLSNPKNVWQNSRLSTKTVTEYTTHPL